MSLLKWQEIAKRKTELGQNINAVEEAIISQKFGEQTSQSSFEKMFKPITTKLDDLKNLTALSNVPERKVIKKAVAPNYGILAEDDVLDYGLENLFNEGIEPQQDKQLVPQPPTYEQSLEGLLAEWK